MDDYPAAAQVLEQALDIYRDIGSRQALELARAIAISWDEAHALGPVAGTVSHGIAGRP
jgi:hypothetical protein